MDEIFAKLIHFYTCSLLSAIPRPKPIVEKQRKAIGCDKNMEGVDNSKGTLHQLTPTHAVLATEDEFVRWSGEKFTVCYTSRTWLSEDPESRVFHGFYRCPAVKEEKRQYDKYKHGGKNA